MFSNASKAAKLMCHITSIFFYDDDDDGGNRSMSELQHASRK